MGAWRTALARWLSGSKCGCAVPSHVWALATGDGPAVPSLALLARLPPTEVADDEGSLGLRHSGRANDARRAASWLTGRQVLLAWSPAYGSEMQHHAMHLACVEAAGHPTSVFRLLSLRRRALAIADVAACVALLHHHPWLSCALCCPGRWGTVCSGSNDQQ